MASLIEINPENPQERKIQEVVDILKQGGIIIYPTDTVYGLGCDIFNQKAIERICKLKGVKPEKANLAFICYDLSDISNYAKVTSNQLFKLMKKTLPGAFTYILDATSEVPKILHHKKKQIGIRIPNHAIPREIVRLLGNPIITTSIKDDDEIKEYTTDPELIFEKYQKLVDAVISGGCGGHIPSTIVDGTNDNFTVIRQGLGNLDEYL
jgi:tRNA threonylcarbamoyl adenosine modification protein (Sua5/YciO/YrdC/YwlC family)